LYKPAQLNTTLYLPGKTVVSIACGGSHSALLTSDGAIYTFGANKLGQLGDGTTTDRNYPVAVAATGVLSGKTIKYVSLGVSQTIVVGSDSKLYGWGSNYQRLLGVNSSTSSFSTPQQTAIYYPQQNNIAIAST
jgi:alpha-tubulin suppressor-like RCC1 family protein